LSLYKYTELNLTCWVPTDVTTDAYGNAYADARDIWVKTGRQGCYINENDLKAAQIDFENALRRCESAEAHPLEPNPGRPTPAAYTVLNPSPKPSPKPGLQSNISPAPSPAGSQSNASPTGMPSVLKLPPRPSRTNAPTTLQTAVSAAKSPSPATFSQGVKTFQQGQVEAKKIVPEPTSFVRGGKTFARNPVSITVKLLDMIENIESLQTAVTSAPAAPTAESPHWDEFETVPAGITQGSWR
jgi:hypothetical protein